jgi:hypothetical protein
VRRTILCTPNGVACAHHLGTCVLCCRLVLVGSTGAVAKAVSVLEHQIRTLEDQIDRCGRHLAAPQRSRGVSAGQLLTAHTPSAMLPSVSR